jgi:hypothetical protein
MTYPRRRDACATLQKPKIGWIFGIKCGGKKFLNTEPLWPISLDFLGYPQSKNACEVSPTGICYENTQPLGREILEITF